MDDIDAKHWAAVKARHADEAAADLKRAKADARRALRDFAKLRPAEQRRAVEALAQGLLRDEKWRTGSWWAE